ncbi:MAG TPA: hypothetical protein VHK90_17515 [Thermoanaerobaculia bacterium]|nr:hypothetical protein [Thermoanaerobaculia bacterium]
MPIRRILALGVFVLLVVAPVEAQRRRAVRAGLQPVPQQPGGQCHTFGLVRPGLKASYLSVTPSGNATYTITWISDEPTRTHTTQTVQTAQGNADAETVIDGEIVGILRAMKHINVKTTTTVPILGKLTTTVDVDFVPSLALGPAQGWCVGNTWDVAPSVQTITTNTPGIPPTIITNNLIGSQGEVLAVNEPVTVNGMTFNTVKYRSVTVSSNNAVQPSITWTSTEHNIVVKQETLDSAGNVTSTTTVTNIQ